MASAGATYEEVQEPRDGEETQPPRGDLCCDGNEDGDTGEDDVGVRHVRGRGGDRKAKSKIAGEGGDRRAKSEIAGGGGSNKAQSKIAAGREKKQRSRKSR